MTSAATLLYNLHKIHWGSYPQPQGNQPDQVPKELRALVACDSEEAALRCYHSILAALGDSDSGSYYPVILPTLPFLAEILEHGSEFSRAAVLDVLVDLYCCFVPATGFDSLDLPGGRVDLKALVDEQLRELAPLVMAMGQVQGASERLRALATEFREALIDEEDL